MQNIARLTFTLILISTLSGAIWAKTTVPQAEYKRSDTNFYLKSDVLKVDPSAVILPASQLTKKGDSYFLTPEKKAPKEIYLQVANDWIEPITPPNMPASLSVPSNAMQIRELQGDVQVALPSAPANFIPAKEGMTIPNGAVVKTGVNGTVAVLFGGVDSARLIPNSEAAVQQTVTSKLRSTEVDLTVGAVFSKVGQRVGEKEDYKVHTPFGVAAARGTDFVTVAMPSRTDVWVAEGTVQLNQPDGKMVGEVKAEGTGALKIIRFPVMTDPHQTMMADAETMTDAMNIIPMVNVKTKALRAKMSNGIKLSATEKDYMDRIEKVPCLIKLALVEPSVATKSTSAPSTGSALPVTPTTPVAAAPAAPATPAAAHHPQKLAPTELDLRKDGKIDFQGSTLSLDELTPKLTELAKAKPVHPVLIKGQENVTPDQLKKVVDACHAAKLKRVTVFKAKPAAGAAPARLPLVLRADGKVDFQGATLSLDELTPKLADLAKATPTQPIVIKGADVTTPDQVQKVLDMCHAAKLTKVTVLKAKSGKSKPGPAKPAATPPAAATPVPSTEAAPAPAAPTPPPSSVTKAKAKTTPTPSAEATATPPVAKPPSSGPIDIDLRADGKVDFQGATISVDELAAKLKAIAKASPTQQIIVKGREIVTSSQLKKVLDACHDAKLKKVTVPNAETGTESPSIPSTPSSSKRPPPTTQLP